MKLFNLCFMSLVEEIVPIEAENEADAWKIGRAVEELLEPKVLASVIETINP